MSTELMIAEAALSMKQMIAQRELVVQAMKDVMKVDQHYGTIPGCGDKPTLKQPGAQALGFLFRLRPEYIIEQIDLPHGHREIRVLCKLYHSPSGLEVGQGVGMCSSMESKYRFRNASKSIEWTTEPVPPVFWNINRKLKEATTDEAKEQAKVQKDKWLQTIFQDDDVSTIGYKKDANGQWFFVKYHGGEGKVDNENIDDVFNTVLKIGKKRAYVDSIITATASSDLFTQDLEDIAANLEAVAATPDSRDWKPGAGAAKADDKPQTTTTVPKGEKKPAAARTAPATATNETGVKTWKDAVVHVGDKKGSIYGKRLGDLPELSITNLRKKLLQIPEDKRTPEDNHLIAAIAIHDSEKNKPEPEKKGNGVPSSVEMLRAKCEALKIDIAIVLKVANRMGDSAKDFFDIESEMAAHMLQNWDDTAQAIKDELDEIPMGDK